MKRNYYRLAAATALAGWLCGMTHGTANETPGTVIREALAKVNSQCPETYPGKVSALPEVDELAESTTDELMQMLQSWNPSLRGAAAGELGQRGDAALPLLMKGVDSQDWRVRAGAAEAMAAIIREKMRNWQEVHPEIKAPNEAQDRIRTGCAAQGDVFIRLARDSRLEVRVAALKGLGELAPQSDEATGAVLDLCLDDDSYLAQDAMIILEKEFAASAIQQDQVIAALKAALKTTLPRGKGHLVVLISRMDEASRRQFIPDLLQHLDWQPNRDTMFGAGGQEMAVRMLTEMKVKELVPRLPKLMAKTMRGPGLFAPCLDSARAFGKDSRVILPELRQMMKGAEPTPAELKSRQGPDLAGKFEKLRETVLFLEAR